MYDLKTATRLYVLEGHRKGLAACSFSPDGRRLVTASIEEGAALVWKVGSSISSFFNPGAPPRQGTASGEPFKTFPFMVPDAGKLVTEHSRRGTNSLSLANITQTRMLEAIRFEWTADRSVKLKISDTTLTFSTG
jgi:WD40 repeat protein